MAYGERRGFSSPINVGETYDVTIEDVGRDGDGIARVEGFVVFVPNTKKGDKVKIRVTKVSRKVGFAEIVAD
jgi:predicted RNA-binding protein with TRAM domain